MRATIRLCIVYGGIKMADYQKMYTLLCSAIDSVLDGLQEIPLNHRFWAGRTPGWSVEPGVYRWDGTTMERLQ